MEFVAGVVFSTQVSTKYLFIDFQYIYYHYYENRTGTGVNSIKWIQTLNTDSWTGITADRNMLNSIQSDSSIRPRSNVDQLVIGNWMDENFCASLGCYDTILADYLIGAVDGFSPYEQDVIVKKLRAHLNPAGKLYLISMNPIPDHASFPGDVVGEVRRARDSCILLAGHKPYREFPLHWTLRHLEAVGFKVVQHKSMTILHSEKSIIRQLNVGRSKLPYMAVPIRDGMTQYLNDLE